MNKNLLKHHQVMSTEHNLDKPDVKKRKLDEVHQSSSNYANTKYDVQLCKKNAAKSLQNETLPSFDGFDEPG